ncbi:polyphosphate polymerase domain-containing protein [Bacillus timonensis]|nr:polyphosphate polymerase domain-containing protein [Bacillus timonensis]
MEPRKTLRHELKYYINEREYEILSRKVGMLLELDKYSADPQGYHIRSLYFDNVYDTDLFTKNYGVFKRKKYRIRIYNKRDDVIRLERKNRYGEYINKDSVPISRGEYEALLRWDYEFLRAKEHPLYRDFYLLLRSEQMSPRVIVDYIREAYIGSVSEVRITFDKQLQAGINSIDLFDPNIVTVEALESPLMVMEVKYNEFLPTHIRRILQLDRHNRSAISKYVICREKAKEFYTP